MGPEYIFHFISLSSVKKLRQFISRINYAGASAIFDLEDSCLIPFDCKKSAILKSEIRIELSSIFAVHSEFFVSNFFGIRINPVKSKEFYLDIEFLKQLSQKVFWNYIFIPKIENGEEIRSCLDILKSGQVRFGEIIPIAENKKAIDNIHSLLRSGPSDKFSKIAFGHCDYNLDIEHWRFNHHDSIGFWNLVTFIINEIENAGFHYVNSPFLELGNELFFCKMVSTLNRLCTSEFGQVTLTIKQSELCRNNDLNLEINFNELTNNDSDTEIEKIKFANEIICNYNKSNNCGKSFAITKDNKLLISPQEYIAAVNYLKTKISKI